MLWAPRTLRLTALADAPALLSHFAGTVIGTVALTDPVGNRFHLRGIALGLDIGGVIGAKAARGERATNRAFQGIAPAGRLAQPRHKLVKLFVTPCSPPTRRH